MAAVLKKSFPDAEVHYLVNEKVYELISEYSDPNIYKVYPIQKVTVNTVRTICRNNNYDLAVVVYPTFEIALGVFLGNVKYRLGTAYRWYSFLFNIRHYEHRKYSVKHEAMYNLSLLESIGCRIENLPDVHFNIRKESFINLISRYRHKIKEGEKYIIIHVPTKGSAEVWSYENFIKLIEMIISDESLDFKIVLSGSSDDIPKLSIIMKSLGCSKKVVSITDMTLKEFALLISGAEVLISNSTGPIHIAAATGTYVIGLYPHIKTQSPVRWEPLTDKKKIFISDHKYDNSDIMNSITPENVFDFIKFYFNNQKIQKL
ncbi:MAG: glycosyltransferase family 9 protein [Ignavibacteria bacterium]|nr:glycosyltransferase family 9 protein [Ignavibacteria bacterium]